MTVLPLGVEIAGVVRVDADDQRLLLRHGDANGFERFTFERVVAKQADAAAGAEAVLRARALRSSGDFDEYWAFHQQAELNRNHLSRYAGGQSPGTKPPPTARAGRAHLRVVK